MEDLEQKTKDYENETNNVNLGYECGRIYELSFD
jgi:hypothetical protein